jgi:hypothetical protein
MIRTATATVAFFVAALALVAVAHGRIVPPPDPGAEFSASAPSRVVPPPDPNAELGA